jgi:flagella basal body P-ring formation protein FlgA
MAPFARCLIFATATLAGQPLAAASSSPRIEVVGERLRLGDVVTGLDATSAALDIGPAPALGSERLLTRWQLLSRLGRAAARVGAGRLPPSVLVVRAAQRLTASEIEAQVRSALTARLPQGASLRALHAAGGVVLPKGELSVELEGGPLVAGRQTLVAHLRASGVSRAVLVTADVAVAAPAALVRRGDRVTVVVRSPGVRVEVAGIAQQGGAVGARVAVLPACGSKLIQALVTGAGIVEVEP